MDTRGGFPVLTFSSRKDWEGWLDANHETAQGIWLKVARKGSGIASVSQAEAVETALCFGWIDGQGRSHDDQYWLQKFTPRARRSKWSRLNREKAIALMEQGAMRPAGIAEVERAQQDGRWEAAYEPPSTATVPDDLRGALDQNPAAREFFATLDSSNRYAILHQIQDAKKPETRARRIAKFVTMLGKREKLYP